MSRPDEKVQLRGGIDEPNPRGLRFLARTFAAGATYDLVLAILILLSPPALLAAMAIPQPPDPMHFRFAGLMLLVLPLFYLLPARNPSRYAGVAAAGAGARLIGAIFLAVHVAAGAPRAYAAFAAADLLFALLHAIALRAARFDFAGRLRSVRGRT